MRNLVYNTLKPFYPVFNYFSRNRLRVLAYHDIIDPNIFEQQLLWLKSEYNIIDVPSLKAHLLQKKKLPSNPLLITLDDGDRSVYTHGLPVLKKHQISCCLFIVTELIGTNKDFWWNTIRKNEKKKGLSETEIKKVINLNKSVPNEQRLRNLAEYNITYKEQLAIDEVKILNEQGVYIANHSHTHPMFDKLEKGELVEELEQVRAFFEENEVGDYAVFAYPNGNFCGSTENLLLNNGIKIAFLFDHKVNAKKMNPLRISRIAVDSNTPLSEFKTKVSGLHPLILKIKKQL
jgi:peptidoglycan/xylan/chitin deacetylase (PgdA/CDA1 family)